MRKFYVSIAILGCVAGCGGSGGGSTIPVIDLPADSRENSGRTMTYTLSTDGSLLTAEAFTAPVAAPTAAIPDVGGFVTALDRTGDNTFIALNQTEDSFAGIAVFTDDGTVATGVNYGRIGSASVPESGSADLTGDYLSVVTDNSGNDFFSLMAGQAISGTIALSVDFEAQTFDGSVTDRQVIDLLTGDEVADTTAADVAITNGSWNAGGFIAADVSGGRLVLPGAGSVLSEGNLQAFIAGEAGAEIAGKVSIPHNFGGNPTTERGAFVASQE